MQKEMVLQKLKERGCRITKQRQMLLDVILQEECAGCRLKTGTKSSPKACGPAGIQKSRKSPVLCLIPAQMTVI